MRLAAIDIGTNSLHMVIADASGPDGFEVVDRERDVVQVGRGSFASSRLRAEAIRRTVDSLQRLVQLARRHQVDRILCTATAAVREARNGGNFVAEARRACGITPRVIPASEEGRLIYLAVKSALQLDRDPSLMVDIGGGSMQLVIGNQERCLRVVSTPLGALRLTEMFLKSDPPSHRELQRLRQYIRQTMREPIGKLLADRPRRVYGSSGSIHALANVAHGQETGNPIAHVNGYVLSMDSLRRVSRGLRAMTTRQRERLVGIDAGRAEIIVSGAIVLEYLLEKLGADGITLSDFGVREGLVTDYLARHAQEISALADIEDLRLRSVLQCLAKFNVVGEHPTHVSRLSLALFDGLRSAHRLGTAERELLHFAALLHDVGSVIGYDGHAGNSYYIIKHANLRGLPAEELELVANVARYHGKARPRKRDKSFAGLSKTQRRTVRWLAALLRIAEGLDRSHYQLVKSIRVVASSKAVSIRASARPEAQLEIWAARRRVDLLSQLMALPVQVSTERGSESRRSNGPARKTAADQLPATAGRSSRDRPRLTARPESLRRLSRSN